MNKLVLSVLVYLFVMFPEAFAFAQAVAEKAPTVSAWDSFIASVWQVIVTVLVPYFAILVGKIILAGLDWVQGQVAGTSFSLVYSGIRADVIALYETTVKGIEKDCADGVITPDERTKRLAQVKSDAVIMASKHLAAVPAYIKPYLASKLGDLVETALSSLKLDKILPSKSGGLTPSAPQKVSTPK